MKVNIDYIKRLLGTAIGLAIWGSAGIISCLTIFICINLFDRNQFRRQRRSRQIISGLFRLYLKILEGLGLLTLNIHGMEKLKELKGCIVICNHPTLIDTIIIMAHMKTIQCIVKNKLWKNIFVGGIVRSAGYIRNDINPKLFLQECQNILEKGENILIFPEGTRSTPDKQIKMHRGVGNLALLTGANIQYLGLKCTPPTLTKEQKWYKIPPVKPVFTLDVGTCFITNDFEPEKPRSLRVRSLLRELENHYNRYLGYE